MDEKFIRALEREGAEALLDAGITVPVGSLRLPFMKAPFQIRVTLRRPCLGGMIAIAREWLSTDTTLDAVWSMSHEQEMEFLTRHGRALSRMVALCFCRSPLSRRLMVRPVAWAVRQWMQPAVMSSVVKRFIGLMSTDPFLNIIASAEAMNPMKLRASQEEKGS